MKLLDFIFDTFLGRMAAGALALAALIGWFAHDQRKVGAQNVISNMQQSASELAKAGEDARLPAQRPGAVERLLKHSCADC